MFSSESGRLSGYKGMVLGHSVHLIYIGMERLLPAQDETGHGTSENILPKKL
jgi:hypothetical protein